MLDESCDLWRAWLATYGLPTDRYTYDVHVGTGISPDPTLTKVMADFAIQITKKRIDVVVDRIDEILIIEVAPRAGLICIAQLVAYPILYTHTFSTSKPVRPLLVTSKLLTDVEMLLRVMALDWITLEPLPKPASSPTTGQSATP